MLICFLVIFYMLHRTQSQLVWSFESQSWVKVKVVKRCRKRWNEHNLMYINHKECEILQKIHWNSSNVQFQWFPIDSLSKWSKRDQNYANANAFFSDWKFFWGIHWILSRVCHLKADVQGFLKMWWFLCYYFLNPMYGQRWVKFQKLLRGVVKKITLYSCSNVGSEVNRIGTQ